MCSEPLCWLFGTVPAGVCFEMLVQGSDSATCVADFAVAVGELLAERVGVEDADVDGDGVDGLAPMWSKLVARMPRGQGAGGNQCDGYRLHTRVR